MGNMTAGLVAGLVAIVVAALLTPLVRHFATAIGAVDTPGGRRVHVTPTPRLGGIAIVAAYLAGILACLSAGLLRPLVVDPRALWFFLGGGVVIAAAGAVDDVRALGAKKKLFVQCLVGGLAWFGGARILPVLFVPGLGPIEIGATVSFLATVFWIVAFINAINLIDGLDGLAAGLVFLATVTNLVVALVMGNVFAAVLNAALGGAVLGFLVYNFNPATIFMGDTGSMFLGYTLGTAALMSGGQKESTLVSLLVPVVALGLPFSDTMFAMVRRVLARRSIFSADREHLHHRLLDLGLTHRRAVLVLYGATVLLCVAAVAAALGRSSEAGAALTAIVLTLIGITRFAGYFELAVLKRHQERGILGLPTEALRRGLPALILSAESAASPAAIWALLERLLTAGHFVYAEYCPDEEAPAWKWELGDTGDVEQAKVTERTFPIRTFPGTEGGVLRFGCFSDEGMPPSPQLDVLLQLVADAVEAALVRVHVRSPSSMMRVVAPASRP